MSAREAATHRLVYFRGNRLDRWEELSAQNYGEALQIACRRVRIAIADCVELWAGGKRLATFRQRLGRSVDL